MPEILVKEAVFQSKIYSGSVKDVFGIPGQSPYVFSFSDRYSIFDWGEMPDTLAGKGESLAIMGDLFFRFLENSGNWEQWQISEAYPKFWRDSLISSTSWGKLRRKGVLHHSLGLVDDRGQSLAPGSRSRFLAVEAIERPPVHSTIKDGKLSWDYSAYQERPQDVLVPLEVVFRFGAPEGSSFLQRLKERPNYAQEFGFVEQPEAGDLFPYPIVEFFTKLEPTDRFLSREEAMQVAALTQAEIDHLSALTLLIALRLRDIFAGMGLALWDGKFEFAFRPGEGEQRDFCLVDSIGPDELRLIGAGGVHFSKEFLRRVYRGSAWYEAVEKAKKFAKERGEKDWKRICVEELKQSPDKLPSEAYSAAQALYPSLANEMAKIFGLTIFDVPTVQELCGRLQELK